MNEGEKTTTPLNFILIHVTFKHVLLWRKIPYTHQSRMKM